MEKVDIGNKYQVFVHGWIMCKGIESGKYRIEITSYQSSLVANFYKPRGNKLIIRHYVSEIMLDEEGYNGLNNNRTEILSQIA